MAFKFEYQYLSNISNYDCELLNRYYARQFTSSSDEIFRLIEAIGHRVGAELLQQQNSGTPESEVFGTEVAAKKLDCSQRQVRKYVREGKIGYGKHGKNLIFRQAYIDDFLASNEVSAANKKRTRFEEIIASG